MSAEKELLDRITQVMPPPLPAIVVASAQHAAHFPCIFLQIFRRHYDTVVLTYFQARLELLTHRLQSSRLQQPPLPAAHVAAQNDSSLATYAAMQEMLRQQRLAISVAQQRRDDLKREIDRLSRQAETEASVPSITRSRISRTRAF